MKNTYRNWIIVISVLSILVIPWLIYNEIQTPGYCPPYPLLGVPTCYVVPVYFGLIVVSQFIRQRLLASLLFQFGAIAGMATAIWFSVNHVLGNLQCPVLFGLPLCFAAFAAFLVLITLNQLSCIDRDQCAMDR